MDIKTNSLTACNVYIFEELINFLQCCMYFYNHYCALEKY